MTTAAAVAAVVCEILRREFLRPLFRSQPLRSLTTFLAKRHRSRRRPSPRSMRMASRSCFRAPRPMSASYLLIPSPRNPSAIPFGREQRRSSRPAPLKSERVQLKHAKAAKKRTADQRRLEFQGEAEVIAPPQSHIICDAPVAPLSLRLEAALIDGALMLCGIAFTFGVLRFAGVAFEWDKHSLAFLLLGLLTVPRVLQGSVGDRRSRLGRDEISRSTAHRFRWKSSVSDAPLPTAGRKHSQLPRCRYWPGLVPGR